MGGIAPDRIICVQPLLYHKVTLLSSDLVWGETKGNVIKLCYILSGVSSRVIMVGGLVGVGQVL